MAHNALTIKLLDKLGLRYGANDSSDPKVLDVRNMFYKFLVINNTRSAEELNQELNEMLLMAEQAKKQAYNFLSANGLTATELEPSWNEHFMCLELKFKIDGQPIASQEQHYLSYEGREINIRIMSKSSNNNFNTNDVVKMLETKKQAALDLSPNIKTKFAVIDRELQDLIKKFNSRPLSETLEQIVKLNQKLLVLLAVEIIRQDLENPSYNPSMAQIKAKILIIEKRETVNVSKNRRAINIVAYPQAIKDIDDYSQWMLSTNIPKGDISSDERGLNVRRVPNPWDVTQTVCRIKGNKLVSTIKHAEVYRSASVAQLSEDKIHRGIGSDEQKNLHNLIIETARDQIIEMINGGNQIDWGNIFSIKTLYLTLLTPMADKESSSKSLLVTKLPTKLKDTLIKGNEAEQLISLVTALKHIKDKNLKFSPLDIDFILQHVPEYQSPELKQQLENLTVQHEFFFSNFTVNTFQGFDLGMLKTCVQNNELHNTNGIKYLDQHLINFLDKQHHGLGPVIKNILYDGGDGSKREWADIKKDLIKLPINSDALVYKILNLYMQLGDYFASQEDRKINLTNVFANKKDKKANSMLVESYFAAAIEVQLASLMGFDIRTTCKSGKDRTGLFLAILEASAGPPEKFRINLCRALKYSDIKELIEQNRPGCRGVQIDADVMDRLRSYAGVALEGDADEFKKLLSAWESRAVGSIPKRVYSDNEGVIAEYLKDNVPNANDAIMVISSPIINKAKPPTIPPRPEFLPIPSSLRPTKTKDPVIPVQTAALAASHKTKPPLPPPIPKLASVKQMLREAEKQLEAGKINIDPSTLSFKEKIRLFDKGFHS